MKYDRILFIVTAFVFGLAVAGHHPLVAAVAAAFLASDIHALITKGAIRG